MANAHQDDYNRPFVLRTIQQLQGSRPLRAIPCYGEAVALGNSSSTFKRDLLGLKHIRLVHGEHGLSMGTRTGLEDLKREQRYRRRYIVELEWEEREVLDLYSWYMQNRDQLASAVVGALLVRRSSSMLWSSQHNLFFWNEQTRPLNLLSYSDSLLAPGRYIGVVQAVPQWRACRSHHSWAFY